MDHPGWARLERERESLTQERLAFAEERASFAREREAMVLEREASLQHLNDREVHLRESEAALHKEAQDLRKAKAAMEDELRQREASLREMEASLQEAAAKLGVQGGPSGTHGTDGEDSSSTWRPVAHALKQPSLAKQSLLGDCKYAGDANSDGVQKDVLENVPSLVEEFTKTGGVVPLAVHVAEVEAMEQAASRLQEMGERYKNQIEQVGQREANAKALISEGKMQYVAADLKKLKGSMDAQHKNAKRISDLLIRRTVDERSNGIQRFVPMLLKTVEKYNSNFERLLLAGGGEEALGKISNLCAPYVEVKGRTLRQPLPSAEEGHVKSTLMLLLETALHAGPELNRFAHEVVADLPNVQVLTPSKPTKGIKRILQKTQEEYEGDYTRLLDYARASILCLTLVEVSTILERLVGATGTKRWKVCRVKDRLSRKWDSEQSGGNRDILINGRLHLGGNRYFIVELQLHLRDLFVLKGDLHTLYNGARVLGAMEDHTMQHEGLINDNVIDLAKRGVLRKLGISFSELSMKQVVATTDLLRHEPCALLQLDMTSCHVRTNSRPGSAEARKAFEGMELKQLIEPPTCRLACRRLRSLKLGSTGVEGEVPMSLIQCADMSELILKENQLHGRVPAALFSMPCLQVADLSRNSLTGEIPDSLDGESSTSLKELFLSYNRLVGAIPVSIAKCTRLQILNLAGNQLEGAIPAELGELVQLQKLFLDQNCLTGAIPPELGQLSKLVNAAFQKNNLSGAVPATFGQLTALEKLVLGPNPALGGPLPAEIKGLQRLKHLVIEGTAIEQD